MPMINTQNWKPFGST